MNSRFGSLLAFLSVLILGACVHGPTPASFAVNKTTIQVIGILTPDTAAAPLAQLRAVPEGETAYLYLFSMGGDPRLVPAFLQAMEGKTTVCYANAAGGPTFTILQACSHRLVGEKAIVGQSKIEFRGTTGDKARDAEFKKAALALADQAEEIEADRLDLDRDEYDKLLSKGGFAWTSPDTILKRGGADAQVDFLCEAGTHTNTLKRTVRLDQSELTTLEMTVCPVMRRLISPKGLNGPEIGEVVGIPIVSGS